MFCWCIGDEPDLKEVIKKRRWGKTSRILEDDPGSAKGQLSWQEFDVLWADAPLETIRTLLEAWPEAYDKKDRYHRNLVEVRLRAKQWKFLDAIFQEFPHVQQTRDARRAAENGAPLEFLTKYWSVTGSVFYSVYSKDWEKFKEVLKDYPVFAKGQLSYSEYHILWGDAPLDIICALLESWPEAYKTCGHNGTLVDVKIRDKQWEFLKFIIHTFKIVVTAEDVKNACKKDAPLDLFQLMLDQQRNAPLDDALITRNKPGHFRAVLERCPAATNVKEHNTHLTPLLLLFQKKEQMNADWIGPILETNPSAAKQLDFDGKAPLHLAYQHGASVELIDMIRNSYPEAENTRDNLGRVPKELANQSETTAFTPANEALILVNGVAADPTGTLNAEKESYPNDAVVICRGDMLIRDPQATQNEEDKRTNENYSEQVLARHSIFETLLDEFSKLVGVDDKDVIQKAAAIQALAAKHLLNQDGTAIYFGLFDNPGYWYQQEVLKLVMRVYHETQSELENPRPSVLNDAEVCMDHLSDRESGKASLKLSDNHAGAYNDLTRWLTEGLDKSSYSLQGPVIKPLQSLFNKLFIRRGQTSVSVIGDLVRGTLLVENMDALEEILNRIKYSFPSITENMFRHPDKFDELTDFLTYVHGYLNFLPNSGVLPYRFKVNSSQKKNTEPLWYNLNFFLEVPEYHRVGFSEMFVACELQIGLTKEINKHRKVHDAYERDRILFSQPLLKNYDAMAKEEDEGRLSRMGNCTEEDNKLIERVLFGEIASEILIPCATPARDDNKNNTLLFEDGPFVLSREEILGCWFTKPERLCLNNRSLNWHAFSCPKRDRNGNYRAAFRAAGPYKLNRTKRYFIDSFVLKFSRAPSSCTVGLYAHVGPYLIQLACSEISHKSEDIIVKSGRNFSYLEQICPVPVGTTALEVIVYGQANDFEYNTMKLSLKRFSKYID